jgi:hemolysin III
MGWIAITAIFPLMNTLSSEGLFGLFAGGIFYTVGAVIYAVKRPDPFPPHFGFHEIWHLFVLAGTGSHFYSISTLL